MPGAITPVYQGIGLAANITWCVMGGYNDAYTKPSWCSTQRQICFLADWVQLIVRAIGAQ
jgi:hypothetical protein